VDLRPAVFFFFSVTPTDRLLTWHDTSNAVWMIHLVINNVLSLYETNLLSFLQLHCITPWSLVVDHSHPN